MSYTSTCFESLIHLLYPHICAGCGSELITQKQFLCLECSAELPFTNFSGTAGNPIEKIFRGRIGIEAATSFLYFTKQSVIQHLMHQFKYKGAKEIGHHFGKMLGKELLKSERFSKVEGLVPLPLHYSREKKRGYNQAAVLCDGIAEAMNVPVYNRIIKRREKTETQTHKNRMERWDNIDGKFEIAEEKLITGKHLLLVDDVITTGATLESCGQELLKCKNVSLSIASLAYTSL